MCVVGKCGLCLWGGGRRRTRGRLWCFVLRKFINYGEEEKNMREGKRNVGWKGGEDIL